MVQTIDENNFWGVLQTNKREKEQTMRNEKDCSINIFMFFPC